MSKLLGTILVLLVVALIGLPLLLVLGAAHLPPESPLWLLDNVAARALIGCLVVLAWGVPTAFVWTALTAAVRSVVPVAAQASVVWLAAVGYLSATFTLLPPLVVAVAHSYDAAWLAASAVGLEPAGFGLAWSLLVLNAPLHFLAVLVLYLLADSLVPVSGGTAVNQSELLCRGALIGLNAGLNFVMATVAAGALTAPFVGSSAVWIGLAFGILCGLVSFLAALTPDMTPPANAALRFVIGWFAWILPMSWPVVMLGWIAFAVTVLVHVALSLPFHPWAPYFRIVNLTVWVPNGTLFLEGGVVANSWVQGAISSRGAYDLGFVSFVHAQTIQFAALSGSIAVLTPDGLTRDASAAEADSLKLHESGHNLNLAAFGSFFHLIDAVDENVVDRKADAYAERLAEDNDPTPAGPVLSQW